MIYLKFKIKNITSLYTYFNNINNANNIGTYEAFDCKIQISDATILNKNLELCSDNIQELIKGIDEILENKLCYTEIEFCDPNLEFNINAMSEDDFSFIIWCYTYVLGDKSNKANAIGLQFELSRNELLKLRNELQQEWDNRKKMVMMSDVMC